MDQQPDTTSQPPVAEPRKKKLSIALGVGLLLVIVIIAGIFALTSKNQTSQRSANNQTLTVGPHPYLYACNALTRDDIQAAGVNLSPDKGGESVESVQAIPYDQTPSGHYDLAKTVEDPLLKGMVSSKCDYIFTVASSGVQKHVTVTVNQYPDSRSAQQIFKNRQDTAKGAPFASLKNTSFVESAADKDDAVTAAIVLDNRVVELKYGIGNVTPDNAATKLDSLASTIVRNLSNTTSAAKPHDFSGLGTIGSTKLIDPCSALDFKKADEVLGGLHYDQSNVTNDYKYGKASQSAPGISAQCSVHFRYAADDAKQPNYQSQKFDELATRFPNQLILSVASYPSMSEAISAVEGLRKSKSATAEDFAYGDTSFAYTQVSNSLGFDTTTHHFMTVNGGSVITVSVSQGEVKKPYESTTKEITANQAKQLLDALRLKP